MSVPLYSIIYIYLYLQDSERGYRLILIVSNLGLNSDFIFGSHFCLRVLITSMSNRSKNFSVSVEISSNIPNYDSRLS